MKLSGTITKVSGPLVVANGLADANVSDVVRVGEQRLIGEILNMTGDSASIQVYEETSGLGPGAKVETTGMPLSVELGPGMLENIYDGIQRPLPEIRDLPLPEFFRRRHLFPVHDGQEGVPVRTRLPGAVERLRLRHAEVERRGQLVHRQRHLRGLHVAQ